jgi:hypothetical protein
MDNLHIYKYLQVDKVIEDATGFPGGIVYPNKEPQMAHRKLSYAERQALSETIRSKRPLTLEEHQRLGELLFQAEQCAFEAYNLARHICTKRELRPLEKLFATGLWGPIERIRCLLDDKLFAAKTQLTRQHPGVTSHDLMDVYYGVSRRLGAPSFKQELIDLFRSTSPAPLSPSAGVFQEHYDDLQQQTLDDLDLPGD